jgi:protein phosphatase
MSTVTNWLTSVPRELASDETFPVTQPEHEDEEVELAGWRIEAHGATDVGHVRERNEDQFLVADLTRTMVIRECSLDVPASRRQLLGEQLKLLAVADGVGGHGSGDLASAVAINAIADELLRHVPWVFEPGPGSGEVERDRLVCGHLQQVMARAEAQIRAVAERRGIVDQRMATTLTVGLLVWPRLYVAHAGDSRCYLYRAGKLQRITRDHSLGEQLGQVAPWLRHVLVNVVGGSDERLMVEFHRVTLDRGDAVLLCTDGLTRELDDEAIAAHLSACAGANACAASLVAEARARGGRDNITAVVAFS